MGKRASVSMTPVRCAIGNFGSRSKKTGIVFHPPLTREDTRSLVYHEAIAEKLRRDADAVLQRARRNLARMQVERSDAGALLHRWEHWLSKPVDELIANMLDVGLLAREMRQVAPFAGVLTPAERVAAIRRFRQQRADEGA